jgi:FMN phosphatase YigB (HAD superfamily)
MLTPVPLVLMLDVDNTLLDNDRFGADLRAWLVAAFGAEGNARYWTLYEDLRARLGYADYLGALQLFRQGNADQARLQQTGEFLLDYPFRDLLYPGALETIAHLSSLAPVLVLSDGDMVFQPRKILRAGIAEAVAGRVLVYVHKQASLHDLQRRVPAARYAMVDDKPLLLAEMKRVPGIALQTVFVRQGHYALAPAAAAADPAPDWTIARIADLRHATVDDFAPGARRDAPRAAAAPLPEEPPA